MANPPSRLDELVALAARGPAASAAVAHPCDAGSVQAAALAAQLGVIVPILVGPEAKIRAAAEAAAVDISGFRIVSTPHSHASAAEAVRLVRAGDAQILVKGSLHTKN